ncbi:MAG: 50S ribosomal protein L9 [Azospirillaceae bacterium]
MEVILLERIERLGQIGDVVRVKPGFARNYLLPQKKALRATKGNLEVFEAQRADLETRNAERRAEAEAEAKKIEGARLTVIRQAGDSGQLYGSVSARDIADGLAADGFEVARTQVAIDRPIKSLGLFPVRLVLHPEVQIEVTVNVARSAAEAEAQLAHGGMVAGRDLEEEAEQAVLDAEEVAELVENPETVEEVVEALQKASGQLAEEGEDTAGDDENKA